VPLAGPTPLSPSRWPRSAAWRHALDGILREMSLAPLQDQAAVALARLSAMPGEAREALASVVLAGTPAEYDLAPAVFIGAALQVYWTTRSALCADDGLDSEDPTSICPICGTAPVAGVVLGDRKLRYLICGLCGTQWHLTRVVCAQCRATDGLSYFTIEGRAPGVKAEACAGCRTYLKLFYLEEIPLADGFADDVATLALDLMVAEEGYVRASCNYFLLPR
jgi:FdhE protein